MTNDQTGRLVILSGPSCVGKSPLANALAKFYPELRKTLQALVLYNSREARPGEVDAIDYHFRSREDIEQLRAQERFVVMDVRGDLQALDLQELSASLAKGDVSFEGNPFVGRALQTSPALAKVKRLSIFMSPLSREEILFLKSKPSIASRPRCRRHEAQAAASNTPAKRRSLAQGPGEHRKARFQRLP